MKNRLLENLGVLFSGTALAQPPKKSLRVGEGPRALQEVKNLLSLTLIHARSLEKDVELGWDRLK